VLDFRHMPFVLSSTLEDEVNSETTSSQLTVGIVTPDVWGYDAERAAMKVLGIRSATTLEGEDIVGMCADGFFDCLVVELQNPLTIMFCNDIKSDPYTDLPMIVLVDEVTQSLAPEAYGLGVDNVMTLPVHPEALAMRALRLCERHREQRALENPMGVLAAVSRTVEKHDPYTAGHIERLRSLSGHVARSLGMQRAQVEAVRVAGLLHDIGKIAVPGEILRKAGSLEPHEWTLIKQHPLHGSEIVSSLRQGEIIAPMVRSHHERWDGTGYPDRIGGGDIPLGGRIIAAVDALDAMTTDRPYRKALTLEEARRRLSDGAGTQFDKNIVEALLDLSPRVLEKRWEDALAI
jgi:putative two-component system response regulator